jgi:rhamnulokinase
MKTLDLLSFDLGASSGRAMLGRFDGDRLRISELYRFENSPVDMDGVLSWDILQIFRHLKNGFAAYNMQSGGRELSCFGIDTWGVDYGLLDASGNLLNIPRAYRNAKDADMDAAWQVVPKRVLFDRTGIAAMNFNTVYQLYRRKLEGDPELEHADKLLLLPDLLGYFFTGEKLSEYSNVTTTSLYNPTTRDWDRATIRELGLPTRLFTPIDRAGQLRGRMRSGIAEELGMGSVPLAAVGSHDTASAVAAIPGLGNFAFCSSGTWSLFGVESESPVLTDAVYQSNLSNEGTVQGTFRLLKNIMGLWLIQECRRAWQNQGQSLCWADIIGAAKKESAFRSIIDPDFAPFFAPDGMVEKIQKYCIATQQPIPESVGQIARCVYESLALKYRWTLERLEEIKGASIDTLNIVGGGSANGLLCQLSADATGRPVIAGPAEGACAGNLLMQAAALGELSGVGELREVVRRSFELKEYTPHPSQLWQDAYGRLLGYMGMEVTI